MSIPQEAPPPEDLLPEHDAKDGAASATLEATNIVEDRKTDKDKEKKKKKSKKASPVILLLVVLKLPHAVHERAYFLIYISS